jgi:hypothetical protein
MKIAALAALAGALLATTGCTSARFTPPPAATIRTPAATASPTMRSTDGPYTREREDREFGEERR